MKRIFFTTKEEETFILGKRLAQVTPLGSVVSLDGDLGAGKTVFTKGFAFALGVKETITSPTFNIMKIYNLKDGEMLVHIDAYRLENANLDLGLEEFIGLDNGYTLIEWAIFIEELIPVFISVLKVNISIINEKERRIEIEGDKEVIETL